MANDIPQGWRKCKLGDVAEIIREVIDPQKTPNEIFTLYSIPAFDNQKIPEFLNGYEIQSSKYHIVEKCILISKLNPGVSRVWKIIDPSPDKISSTEFIPLKIKENEGDVAFDYTYYLLKNPIFYKLFEEWANGTSGSHQRIKPNQVLELDILLPPLPEQKAIASVLGSLDDKIDLLRKENQTLEQLAETLFRQWFIEEADDSWEVGRLGDFLSLIESGRRPKGGINTDLKSGIPSIGAENINGLGRYDYSKTRFVSKDFFKSIKKGIIQDYDVLIYKVGAYVGRKSMFGRNYPYDICTVNEHVFILRSNDKLNQFFLYFLLQEEDLAQLNSNSAQPGLNQNAMKSFEIVVPPKGLIDEFGNIVKPLIDKIFFNGRQIRTLENLRDTLLPKLMSGEVRVKLEV